MTIKLNDTELQELATQLRHPSGKGGVTIADNMNENNIKMTESSILELNLKQNEQVLELGHGNCGHLDFLLQQATSIRYVGLEISELMQQEAIKLNKKHSNSDVRFELFNGKTIPFYEKRFDKIFTVNTILFLGRCKCISPRNLSRFKIKRKIYAYFFYKRIYGNFAFYSFWF